MVFKTCSLQLHIRGIVSLDAYAIPAWQVLEDPGILKVTGPAAQQGRLPRFACFHKRAQRSFMQLQMTSSGCTRMVVARVEKVHVSALPVHRNAQHLVLHVSPLQWVLVVMS